MRIGVGLPVDDPDVLHEWAVRADAGPFSTLGLLDRLVWHNPEPLITLAALAGVTRASGCRPRCCSPRWAARRCWPSRWPRSTA